jgi:hypothetical protein
MLVVLASRSDPMAGALAVGWGDQASLLTPRDLSARGWRDCRRGEGGTAVIDGRLVGVSEIDGVLVRLPCVAEHELGHIEVGDRCYVATEMTAFLSAWLSDLACPVLNRPTGESLMGPYWRTEKWLLAAARLGIPVIPVRRSVPAGIDDGSSHLQGASTQVNVIGHSCFGDADGSVRRWATALAAEAGVAVLRARFTTTDSGAAFVDADYWVDINDPGVSEAILALFAERWHR